MFTYLKQIFFYMLLYKGGFVVTFYRRTSCEYLDAEQKDVLSVWKAWVAILCDSR